MTEDKIKNLLQKADQMAARPTPVSANLAAAVRRRADHRRITNIAVPIAAAAMLLIACGVWHLSTKTDQTTRDKDKIASLETQIQQLQARTDATLKLIQEVLDRQRQQRRLNQLEAKLASIPDPLEEIREQVDTAAFYIVYQADRKFNELNLKDSAIADYRRVIELFPQTQSAEVARKRLENIGNNSVNKKI